MNFVDVKYESLLYRLHSSEIQSFRVASVSKLNFFHSIGTKKGVGGFRMEVHGLNLFSFLFG